MFLRCLSDSSPVDSATGSDSNPGTALLPLATLQYAWDSLAATIDLGNPVAVNRVIPRRGTVIKHPDTNCLLSSEIYKLG